LEINSNFSDKAKEDYMLVKKALKGDQSAYSSIMSRYKETIYYLILKMVRDNDDAEDLTIEVFGKAFQRLGQYTSQYAFSTWLFRIATNHSIDYIRKKRLDTISIDKDMKSEEGASWSMDIGCDNKDPEERFIEKQKIKMMRDGVDKLKEPYKKLLELRYFDEYSYDEISEELDIPLGTVKAQLFRARALLSAILENSRSSI